MESLQEKLDTLGKEILETIRSKIKTQPDKKVILEKPITMIIDSEDGKTSKLYATQVRLLNDHIIIFGKISEEKIKEILNFENSDGYLPCECWEEDTTSYIEWEGLAELADTIPDTENTSPKIPENKTAYNKIKNDKFFKPIKKPEDAVKIVEPLLVEEEDEHLLLLTLNSANIPKSIHFLTNGSDSQTTFSVRQIAKTALMDYAKSIILIHNHPSGNPKPGTSDINSTKAIKKALDTLDMLLLDHIIIAGKTFYSFNYENTLPVSGMKET